MPDLDLTRPQSPPVTPLAQVRSWTGARLPPGRRPPSSEASVTGLTLSSRRVHPGDLYAALPGSRAHGASYAADAVAAGAAAVLTDAEGAALLADLPVPVLEVADPRAVLGPLAAHLYGDPAEQLTTLAVTGTQGKTTTTRLLESSLAASGVPTAVVGTVGTRIAGQEVTTALTTPEAPDLHALFAVMVEQGVRCCTMEVSSHALVLGRVAGVVFDVAAFLNLGRDHLDFHRDLEDYFAAKAMLFDAGHSRRGLTNLDDPRGRELLRRAEVPMATFSPSGQEADWWAEGVHTGHAESTFTVAGPHGFRAPVQVPLPGGFNVANALCAIALAGEAGLDPALVAEGMAKGSGVPGRMERVDEGQDFVAVVDYAHKPDALQALLGALRPLTPGRLLLVLGAGGDRDPGKRSMMGEIGARLADVLVVTDDNPRTEDAASIRAAILAGAAAGKAETIEVGDRREAIRAAVGLARAGDTLVVAGKGHETGQQVGDEVLPFDDRDELRAALREGRPR